MAETRGRPAGLRDRFAEFLGIVNGAETMTERINRQRRWVEANYLLGERLRTVTRETFDTLQISMFIDDLAPNDAWRAEAYQRVLAWLDHETRWTKGGK